MKDLDLAASPPATPPGWPRTIPVVSPTDWQAAMAWQRAEEKKLTREMDRVAALRRKMPWMVVAAGYVFQTEAGPVGLTDLFGGCRQLIVYHHMLRAAGTTPCPGCGFIGDQIPHLAHLRARDTALVFVSEAPVAEIAAFRQRMGWKMPGVQTAASFNDDMGVGRGPGFNVFIQEHGVAYRSYTTTARGAETLGTVFALLDITPMGRQERWQQAPAGTPQSAPYQWWRLHDEYAAAPVATCCSGTT